jgi:predicted HTH transcriptional regulator
VDESQLREYIRQGENLYTEFKASDAHPDDIAAALVAFANTEGGRLIFGVVDNGDIIFFSFVPVQADDGHHARSFCAYFKRSKAFIMTKCLL